MVLKQSVTAEALKGEGRFKGDRLRIVPEPELQKDDAGLASIDLRLGRWFSILRGTRHLGFIVTSKGDMSISVDQEGTTIESRLLNEADLTQRQFVPFDKTFVLHQGTFALGGTLEWIRIPAQCTGTIVGKSSWGRRGLIIETAPIVHPGFSGCLTLELTNVGHMPISLRPGMPIAQLMMFRAEGRAKDTDSSFSGFRRPSLGTIRLDDFAKAMTS